MQLIRRWRGRLMTQRAPAPAQTAEPPGDGLPENFEANRKLWNDYAAGWTPGFRGYEATSEGPPPAQYAHLGDEWGRPEDVDRVVGEFILPFVGAGSRVAEVGTGGGRIASRVHPQVGEFWCFDISAEMLNRARTALGDDPRLHYQLLESPRFPDELAGTFDFVYAFDVFVHLDLHMTWRYLQEFTRLVKPGGMFMVHTSNLATRGGWAFFASQERFNLSTHHFVTPNVVATMLSHLPVDVVTESSEDPENFYLGRDYLAVCRRQGGPAA